MRRCRCTSKTSRTEAHRRDHARGSDSRRGEDQVQAEQRDQRLHRRPRRTAATRSIRSPLPASAIASPTNSVGDQEVSGSATMPLHANSATHPAARPSRGGPGSPARGQPSPGRRRSPDDGGSRSVWTVIAPAPSRRPPASRRARAWWPSSRPHAAQPSPAGSSPSAAVPGGDVQDHGVRRVTGRGQAGEEVRSASPRWPSTASSMPPWSASSIQPVESCSCGSCASAPGARAARAGWPRRAPWCQPCDGGVPGGADQPDLEVEGDQVAHDRRGRR